MEENKNGFEENLEETEEKVEETVENEAEKTEEKVEEASTEISQKTAEVKEAEKSVKETPVIKKKKKLDKTNIIVIVVCAVIVLACLAFVAFKQGWIKIPVKAEMKMEDYSVIEVLNSDVEVTDETVESYIQNLVSSQTKQVVETEGVVAEGDLLDISYVGTLTETGEKPDSLSGQNKSCTVGAGQFIEGFETGLIGQHIGSTVTEHLVFPEDYANEELAGKAATFEITINSRTTTEIPELNDAFVQEYSYNYLPKQLNSVAELKEYVYDYIYKFYLHEAMMQDLQAKQTVKQYDPEQETNLVEYCNKSLEYSAAMYGYDVDTFAQLYGYASEEEYSLDMAHEYLNIIMLVDKIFSDKNLTVSQEELDQSIVEYMARAGYNEMYTLEEFKENSGEDWLYLYENLEYKYNKALTALEPNVVFVDELSRDKVEETIEEESASN